MSWSLLTTLCALVALLAPTPPSPSQSRRPTAPESFTANANVANGAGAAAATIAIQVDRYSPEADRNAVAQALKQGGYPAFLIALRKAPAVGTLTLAGQTFDIRWAREQPVTNGRTIVLITDKPVYFVGGGNVNAKPREGYDVALLQFSMDDAGLGFKGTMAAAARVKPGGDAGVQIDDYADKPIELRTIRRTIK
jgi:hypothetical protein